MLSGMIDEVLAMHADKAKEYRSARKKMKKTFGYLVGQVVRASETRADITITKRILLEKNSP